MSNAQDYLAALQHTKPLSAPTIRFRRLDPKAKLPVRATPGAVGWDVFAFLLTESGRPSSRACHQRGVTPIPTGIAVEAPPGYYIQVCSRSGLASRGVIVANAPGIIDPDYTGELVVLLLNGSFETHYVSHEHRIAQLILAPLCGETSEETTTPPRETDRGPKGFGSTGA